MERRIFSPECQPAPLAPHLRVGSPIPSDYVPQEGIHHGFQRVDVRDDMETRSISKVVDFRDDASRGYTTNHSRAGSEVGQSRVGSDLDQFESWTGLSYAGSDSGLMQVERISKPPGRVGKPNHGGYSLRKALGWEDELYDAVHAYFRKIVSEQELKAVYSQQDPDVIMAICEDAKNEYPILARYNDDWASKDFLYALFKALVGKTGNIKKTSQLNSGRRNTKSVTGNTSTVSNSITRSTSTSVNQAKRKNVRVRTTPMKVKGILKK
ncbi:hypothetical protein M422DRAFT_27338 [Sphaerobolus stellatus SS14]|nr:hypothetical protein M422DRAFT_27338 [Sphaerobolus stellatus SS14]